MEKRGNTNLLESEIEKFSEKFLKRINDSRKEILLVSHFDTDGITSAAILLRTLQRLDIKFSVKILKSLEKKFIDSLPKDKIILFSDLASNSLEYLEATGIENIFIIDHHEVSQKIPKNVELLNPMLLDNKEKISSSGLTYLFSKSLGNQDKDLAKLAVLGMIGDRMDRDIDTLNNGVLGDGEIKKKRGLLLYPSTRPLNRTLEYSSFPYIPGVTGDSEGVRELLREASLTPEKGKYKSLIELNEDEMQRLVTSIMLRNPKTTNEEMVGDIFLIKFFNKLEDARELSAMINACSRLGHSTTALKFCLELPGARQEATEIHVKYKQHLISGLEFVEQTEKIMADGLVIINAKDNIKETIIGTIASILSSSPDYEEGTVIITMAYYEDKIKISSRIAGRGNQEINLRELLAKVIDEIGGEVGGHKFAAGGIIAQDKEDIFIEKIEKALEIKIVKI